jgi:hypothetical protein
LTVADYEALPEDEQHRWELLEGNLVIAPSPSVDHAEAMGNLYEQLKRQCPSDVVVLQDVDVNLDLDPPISLTAHHLGDELGYVADPEATGIFTTSAPYPLTIALDRLV